MIKRFSILFHLLFFVCIFCFFIVQLSDLKNILPIQLKTVVSESMAESHPVNSLLVVKSMDPQFLQVGDVISFDRNAETVTHRIVAVKQEKGGLLFQTKGDSNETEDGLPVKEQEIQGKVIVGIAKIGGWLLALQTRRGMWAFIWTLLDLVLLESFIKQLFSKSENKVYKHTISN